MLCDRHRLPAPTKTSSRTSQNGVFVVIFSGRTQLSHAGACEPTGKCGCNLHIHNI